MSDSNFENVPVKEFGDLIFSIGAAINLGVTKMGELTPSDGKILRELGHALRMEHFNDVSENGFPELAKMKFDPAKHSKVFIYKIIKEMLHNLVSFERAIQYQSADAIRGESNFDPKALSAEEQADMMKFINESGRADDLLILNKRK